MLLNVLLNIISGLSAATGIILAVVFFGFLILVIKLYRKPIHGKALVRTGSGGTRVAFEKGFFLVPVLHRLEIMDITLKTIVIERTGDDGLICKDNLRADIKVAFFVRVNHTVKDVKQVALSIGCARASHQDTLVQLFEAKFSEALKTVGKKFDFVALYTERKDFKKEILDVIGTELNGYHLDDCAIDFLEQTPLSSLKKDNILDAEGIRKITELTADQQILTNQITRDRDKTITKQDVEARETILELNRQLTEKEEKQKREIANITDREHAETVKVAEEQRLKHEKARIAADEEIQIAEWNKERQIVVASKNKERTEAIETEKVEKDRQLEVNERERVVSIEQIKKEKAIEEEKKNIQEVIRERVTVQKAVVVEEEKIKDTHEFADADRQKRVAITRAEMLAEQAVVKRVKEAEADKNASKLVAEKVIIQADAEQASAGKKAEAKKIMAEAQAAEEAVIGKSEAQVMEAKADAIMKQGETDAAITELQAMAEAKKTKVNADAEAEGKEKIGFAEASITKQKGLADADIIKAKANADATGKENIGVAEAKIIEAKAIANELKGIAEAKVINEKYGAEANGIHLKADAMKKLDGVGKDHEEFKLRLQTEKDVRLAQISIQKDIANAQAQVISESVKSAKIDIVGGETMFFDKIIGSITKGKSVDQFVDNSNVITEIKDQFFNTENGLSFKDNIKNFIGQFGITAKDIKDLSISALLLKLAQKTNDTSTQSMLEGLLDMAISKGVAEKPVKDLGIL